MNKARQLNEIKQNATDFLALIDEAYELGFEEGYKKGRIEMDQEWIGKIYVFRSRLLHRSWDESTPCNKMLSEIEQAIDDLLK